MNINVTGRGDNVTAGMKKKAAEKVDKLNRYYDRITWIDVLLEDDSVRKVVEVSAGLNRGATIVGKAEADDMYTAIDLALDKVTRQVRRHKEKLKGHRARKEPAVPEADTPDTEPSYQDVIEEMRDS